jgi:hypothetical protein
MVDNMMKKSRGTFYLMVCILLASLGGMAQEKPKPEVIQATARGKDRAAGKTFSVNIIINSYSTPDEQQALVAAFNSGGMNALVRALEKSKSKGRLAVTGTVGYDISYVSQSPTDDGRKIRIVTTRPIHFREAYNSGRSMQYQLSGVELNLSDTQSKSTGTLIIAAKLRINKDKQLEIESFQSPWELVNIMKRQ